MENRTLQLVNFEQAKKLQSLGFNWGCYAPSKWYDEEGMLNDSYFYPFIYYTAPTVAIALEWIRLEKGICCSINIIKKPLGDLAGVLLTLYKPKYIIEGEEFYFDGFFDDYNSAESKLLDKLLDLIKNKDK